MRSPRSRFETACRVGAFALLGWLVGGSVIPSAGIRLERATVTELPTSLPKWTLEANNVAMHADLPTVPAAWQVDWLAALRRVGRPVSWSGTPPALAISTEPLRDPSGGIRIDVA